MPRHKHADVIIAWANGEEIEVYDKHVGWTDCAPNWHPHNEYRIKPKIVKKEGWVNVYRNPDKPSGIFYATRAEADRHQKLDNSRVACIRIEWEEEG